MGAACAKILISKNKDWKVVIGDINVKGGEVVAESLGKDCVFVKCDASKYEDILKLFTTAKDKFGRVDFGINLRKLNMLIVVAANAGVAETMDIAKPINADIPPKPEFKTLDINLYGPTYAAYL